MRAGRHRRSLFLRATSYTAAIGGLYVIGLLAFGSYFLKAAYGEKWLESVAALQILAFFGLFRSLSALVGDLLVGTGEVKKFRRICALQLGVACAGLYLGVTLGGISGVALVMAVGGAVFAGRGMEGSPTDSRCFPQGFRRLPARTSWRLCSRLRSYPCFCRSVLPVPESLLAVLAAAIAVTLCFVLGWLAFDRELRAESTQWWNSRWRNRGTSSGEENSA